jgi:hypothetical protein
MQSAGLHVPDDKLALEAIPITLLGLEKQGKAVK